MRTALTRAPGREVARGARCPICCSGHEGADHAYRAGCVSCFAGTGIGAGGRAARDRDNPILLFLHGGPAAPEMPTSWTFESPWEDYFTVVQWDQRGAGKTYASNDPKALAATMTVKQMTSDAEEVVRYLQNTYGKKKIFLLGHSWGSVLGVE